MHHMLRFAQYGALVYLGAVFGWNTGPLGFVLFLQLQPEVNSRNSFRIGSSCIRGFITNLGLVDPQVFS